MGKSQREKGKRHEREIAQIFRDRFGVGYRGAPLQASGDCQLPDVVVNLPVHLECSHGQAPSPHGKLDQAIGDAKAGVIPIAVTKRNRGPNVATLLLSDLLDILEEWQKATDK